ncbi:hypothetical protein L6R50_14280 [Myxococcota bacterium]|nr:hypothetical protein [Myxococcota bacterium]
MLQAILKGKIPRSVDGYEDLLTSVVFGALDQLPVAFGFQPFLDLAKSGTGGMDGDGGDLSDVAHRAVDVDVEFWPWWHADGEPHGAEPDVTLTLKVPGQPPTLLVVECKRKSPKSGRGDRDQLARQVRNGRRIAGTTRMFLGLLYVTEDLSIPEGDLAESHAELRREPVLDAPMWWISWRDVGPILSDAAHRVRRSMPLLASLTEDAAACLERWGLERYQGCTGAQEVPPYRFCRRFTWPHVKVAPPWTFGRME